jgi:FdhE protein
MDPVADDVASLGLDLLMKQGPYRRAGYNPYLIGY